MNYPPPLTTTATTKNQLTGFGYDIAGNLVSNGSANYVYDAENRITSTAGTSYRYDGDGERVVKCSGAYPSCSSATLYWKGTGSDALAEADWTGTITSEYMFFGGRRVAKRNGTGNNAYYYFADHLGSADVITGPAGAKSRESDYQPYGNEVVISGASFANNYKFNGKERDSESGLDNFGARYNASNLGRFMTPDWAAKPVTVPYANFGNPQSLNLYAYVENNPTTLGDPDGHQGNQSHADAAWTGSCSTTKNDCKAAWSTDAAAKAANQSAQNTWTTTTQGQNTLSYSFTKNTTTEHADGSITSVSTTTTATFSTAKGHEGQFLGAATETTTSQIPANMADPVRNTTTRQQAISYAQAAGAMGANRMAEGGAAALPSFAAHFGNAVANDARSHPMKYVFAAGEIGLIFTPLPAGLAAIEGIHEVKASVDAGVAAGDLTWELLQK